jgi:ribosomal protein S18 acetylase RimI-like enzyme
MGAVGPVLRGASVGRRRGRGPSGAGHTFRRSAGPTSGAPMSWSTVRVRPATALDLPSMLDFGEELREQLGPAADGKRVRLASASSRAALEARYAEALVDPERHLVVAVAEDDAPLGMAMFTIAPSNALLDTPALHVSHVVVADRHKRRGAGKALVAAAATFAEQRGLEQVVVSVHPGSREANRFFARLGFAPLAVSRVAPTAVVRRRLLSRDTRPAVHVVRRRPRRLGRLPVTSSVLPLGPADPEG